MTLRIVFDHQIFAWQKYGGVSRYIYQLAKNLVLFDDVKVDVVCPFYVNEYFNSNSDFFKVWGTKIPQIPKSGRLLRALNSYLAPRLIHNLKPDIFHETYYSNLPFKPRDAKTILTVHDMIHEIFPKSFRENDLTTQEKLSAINRADHIICVSHQTQKDLIRLTEIPIEKTSVVHHGLSPLSFIDVPKKPHFDKPFLLFVGHRSGYKNFDGLLKAYARSTRLKNHFLLITFGGEKFSNIETDAISKLGLRSDQIIQIFGSDETLASLYKQASCFVYPSLYEGFGIPPLEAMSLGCPVVCSNVSSIPEVVGNAALFFDPENIEQMTQSIEKCLFDSIVRESMVRNGYQQAKKYSWEVTAKKTLEIYTKVLST